MNLHSRYRLPLRFVLSLHQLQLCQSINIVVFVFLGSMIKGQFVRRAIVNDVLLSDVVASIG